MLYPKWIYVNVLINLIKTHLTQQAVPMMLVECSPDSAT